MLLLLLLEAWRLASFAGTVMESGQVCQESVRTCSCSKLTALILGSAKLEMQLHCGSFSKVGKRHGMSSGGLQTGGCCDSGHIVFLVDSGEVG